MWWCRKVPIAKTSQIHSEFFAYLALYLQSIYVDYEQRWISPRGGFHPSDDGCDKRPVPLLYCLFMRSCTGDSCFFCTNAPAPSRTPPPENLSNLWSTFGPSSSTISSTSSAVSRCLKLAAGNHLTMRYCLSGTRAMMRSGNAMPYTPAHVTPYTAPRAVSWITVNFWVSLMGTRSTYAGCDSPPAQRLDVHDEEGDAVDELVTREGFDGHEHEVSPENRAGHELDDGRDEEADSHEHRLDQVRHPLLQHDVRGAGLAPVLPDAHQRARVHRRLGQHAVRRWKTEEAEQKGVETLEQEVVVVRGGLLQVEVVNLSELRADVVVEEEEHGDDQRGNQRDTHLARGHVPQVLRRLPGVGHLLVVDLLARNASGQVPGHAVGSLDRVGDAGDDDDSDKGAVIRDERPEPRPAHVPLPGAHQEDGQEDQRRGEEH